MSGANPQRGEAELRVGGHRLVLRPSFGALVAAEGELGPLFALVERAAEGRLALGELACLFWHCVDERPDELTRDAVGEAVVGQGLAARTVRGNDVVIALRRHQPVPVSSLAADPGTPVRPPDWPDAVGTVRIFDIPSLSTVAATVPHLLVVGAGSDDGWRGADAWFVPRPGAAPIALGVVRPAAALGMLDAPLARGSAHLFDRVNVAWVRLVNPSMILESVSDAQMLAGANRAMIGPELIQFGAAEEVEPGLWRLSRLLRGRAGTETEISHGVETPFVLLEEAAGLILPDAFADDAQGGAAVLQWAHRNGTTLSDGIVPTTAMALRPLAPVHGRIRHDALGGVTIDWNARSRVDAGWRDHGDGPSGESRDLWRVTLMPELSGVGPWDCPGPTLAIDPGILATVPPGHAIAIRRVGDFALSPPLILPLT